jgi:hypothetical protein
VESVLDLHTLVTDRYHALGLLLAGEPEVVGCRQSLRPAWLESEVHRLDEAADRGRPHHRTNPPDVLVREMPLEILIRVRIRLNVDCLFFPLEGLDLAGFTDRDQLPASPM